MVSQAAAVEGLVDADTAALLFVLPHYCSFGGELIGDR